MSAVRDPSDPVAFVTGFSRYLRERGLDATPATSIDAVRALVAVDLADLDDVYHALCAVFVSRYADFAVFDAAFEEWWGPPAEQAATERASRSARANPPVIARTENDRVLFDPRTVLDDESLLRSLRAALNL